MPTPRPAGPPMPAFDRIHQQTPLGYARAVWADDCPHEVAPPSADIEVVTYSHYKTAFPVPQRCGKVAGDRRGVRHLVHLQGGLREAYQSLSNGRDDCESEKAPLLVLAKGKKGVDDFGDADAALDEDYWLGLSSDFEGKYTLEVDEDVAAGLGVETRDGPLVLESSGGDLPLGQRKTEGCSCLFGNPCQDKYVCNVLEQPV